MYYNRDTCEWRWYHPDALAPPTDERFGNEKLRPFYERHLADRRVLEIFEHVSGLLKTRS